jgi:hypothetical protein
MTFFVLFDKLFFTGIIRRSLLEIEGLLSSYTPIHIYRIDVTHSIFYRWFWEKSNKS